MLKERDSEIISKLQSAIVFAAFVFLILTFSFLELAYFPGKNRGVPQMFRMIEFVTFWGLWFEIKYRADSYLYEIFNDKPEGNYAPTPPKTVGWAAIMAGLGLWLAASFILIYPTIYYRSGVDISGGSGMLVLSVGLASLAYWRIKRFLPHT